MSMTTLAPVTTSGPQDSYTNGYIDGELAAFTGLDTLRAQARADMAAQHDPQYAAGLTAGYQAALNL